MPVLSLTSSGPVGKVTPAMNTRTDIGRRCVATALAALILSLSVAVPLMERGDLSSGSAVESGHDPARCGQGHDHRICTQIGGHRALAASAYESRLAHLAVRARRPDEPRSAHFRAFLEGPPSRAPPLT